jgi:hypothetical protein
MINDIVELLVEEFEDYNIQSGYGFKNIEEIEKAFTLKQKWIFVNFFGASINENYTNKDFQEAYGFEIYYQTNGDPLSLLSELITNLNGFVAEDKQLQFYGSEPINSSKNDVKTSKKFKTFWEAT